MSDQCYWLCCGSTERQHSLQSQDCMDETKAKYRTAVEHGIAERARAAQAPEALAARVSELERQIREIQTDLNGGPPR